MPYYFLSKPPKPLSNLLPVLSPALSVAVAPAALPALLSAAVEAAADVEAAVVVEAAEATFDNFAPSIMPS